MHLRKPGRKLTNWPVDPALAVFQVENKVRDPEPCISFGGKRPKSAPTPTEALANPNSVSPQPPAPAPDVAPPAPPPPSPPHKKVKKPTKGHPLIYRVNAPKVDSRPPSEAGSQSSLRQPVSRVPLWVREQLKKQADANKQTRCWEKQLATAENHPSAQVHKKGSRTTL